MNKPINPIDPVELDDAPTNMAVSRKIPRQAQQILQNAKEHGADRSIEKCKARFVTRRFSQKEGVDYDETFALVARYTSIRSIITIASTMGWKLHQMDVKTAFLDGIIEEEVYIEQPEGFVVHGKESRVCKLKKALYGLKQALVLGMDGQTDSW